MKPAFYALRPGGWRDYVTLLHPPYTLWHLSYCALGAALAPTMRWTLLGWTALAFFLALGVAAHALDELKGRPLRTRIPARVLLALAALSLAGACAIGIVVAAQRTWWLLAFVAAGAFLVVAYDLELLGFHTGFWFAAAWGAFPALTAYFASAETIRVEAVAVAAFAFATSWVQRTLSTPVRAVRRRPPEEVSDAERAIAPHSEQALMTLAAAHVLLAAAVLLARAAPTMTPWR
ncbi:MAG TPA: hypothetical protein VHD91_12695 [Gaiellaceae bacterium]|nr:hypothetical protein [Gaiellaceae bacterium]